MTGDHIIYIPAILALGFVLGFIIGRKTLMSQLEARREAIKRRKARRKAVESGAQTTESEKPTSFEQETPPATS